VTYSSQSDVQIAAGGSANLVSLTDQENSGVIDLVVLAKFQAKADSTIDGYLRATGAPSRTVEDIGVVFIGEWEGVRFEELMAERDRMVKKHPKTKFILAHMGWHANNLARLGKMFDEMPNAYAEVGAILYDLGRQPRFAREFFIKYQDRILFGKDSFQPDEYPYYWRVFETADEYFDYYRDYHAFWKLYGMDLPDDVLKKLYYKNALKLVPGLPKTGFPN